jgi:hypothetical protein
MDQQQLVARRLDSAGRMVAKQAGSTEHGNLHSDSLREKSKTPNPRLQTRALGGSVKRRYQREALACS